MHIERALQPELSFLVIANDANVISKVINENHHKSKNVGINKVNYSKILQGSFDIILIDLEQCGDNAFEIPKQIQSIDSKHTKPAVMALSQTPNEKLIYTAYQSGMCNFITKPFTSSKLLAAISFVEFQKIHG